MENIITTEENQDPNIKVASVKEQTKQIADNSSDEEDKMDEDQVKLWSKIDEVLKDYHLTQFQKVACRKFIKDKVGNPKNENVERLRQWLFMKMNG